jgi:hypothetical protein
LTSEDDELERQELIADLQAWRNQLRRKTAALGQRDDDLKRREEQLQLREERIHLCKATLHHMWDEQYTHIFGTAAHAIKQEHQLPDEVIFRCSGCEWPTFDINTANARIRAVRKRNNDDRIQSFQAPREFSIGDPVKLHSVHLRPQTTACRATLQSSQWQITALKRRLTKASTIAISSQNGATKTDGSSH